MYVGTDGDGHVEADIKNFRVPHSNDPTLDILYACPEGPEAAMYIRGTAHLANGRAFIELPEHFRLLAVEAGMTVQLTPRSAQSRGLAAVQVSLNGIEVQELFDSKDSDAFDWRVEAVRKGFEDYEAIRSGDEALPTGISPEDA